MSITVNQIVLHQLVKHAENETTTMESVLRDELLYHYARSRTNDVATTSRLSK